MLSRCCSLSLAIALFFASRGDALAGLITFTDSTFADSDWSQTIIVDTSTGGAATSSASQVASGGDPGAFRSSTYTFPYGANPPETVRIANLTGAAFHDPAAQGAIQSLSFSLDYNLISQTGGSPGTTVGILLLQSSSYYLGPDVQSFFTLGTWQSHTGSALTSADFTRVAGSGPSSPDFSASGSIIGFGYGLGIGAGVGDATLISSSFGVDDWSVELTTVPEPGTSVLGLLALVACNRFLRSARATSADQ